MSDKNEMINENKVKHDKTTQKEDDKKNKGEKRNWKGVFEDVTYSSGPGDNIFIFG